jgi:hypothetical protein
MRDSDRRVMRCFVGEHLLLDLFKPLGQCVAVRLNHPQLPDDATVQAVHSDYSRRALCAIVHSREFPIVPAGKEIPVFAAGTLCDYEARYVVNGYQLTPWKPLEVAIQEQQERQMRGLQPNFPVVSTIAATYEAVRQKTDAQAIADGDRRDRRYDFQPVGKIDMLRISPALKAKLEACDEIVDRKPLSDSADAARMAQQAGQSLDVGKSMARLVERYIAGERFTWAEVQKVLGCDIPKVVDVKLNGKVVGIAREAGNGKAEICVGQDAAAELARVLHPGTPIEYPGFPNTIVATAVPAEVLAAGESNFSGAKHESEAEFFKRSVLAE